MIVNPSIKPQLRTALKFSKIENLSIMSTWIQNLINDNLPSAPSVVFYTELECLVLVLKLNSLSNISDLLIKLSDMIHGSKNMISKKPITLFTLFNRNVADVDRLVFEEKIYTFPRIDWSGNVSYNGKDYKQELAGRIIYKDFVYEVMDVFVNKKYFIYSVLYNDKNVAKNKISDYYKIKYCESLFDYGKDQRYFETDLLGLKEFLLKDPKELDYFIKK